MRILFSILVLVLAATNSNAQEKEKAFRIALGQSVTRTLQVGEHHLFEFEVETPARYTGSVDKNTADVVIITYSPAGDQIGQFDGQYPFSFLATTTGKYLIEIIPINDDEPSDYVISIEKVEEWQSLDANGNGKVDLKTNETVLFAVELESTKELRGQVDQANIDVVVQVLSAQGVELTEFNSRTTGFENFVVRPDSAGTVYVRVFRASEDQDGLALISTQIVDQDIEFVEGSGVVTFEPTQTQIQNLALLGRVWGFLKYHHPEVTIGKFNWDFELFRVLPAVIAAESSTDAQVAIYDWVSRVGSPQQCDPCAKTPDDLHLAAPVGWIQDTELLGRELSTFLLEVRQNRHLDGDQYYVAHVPLGIPYFNNEASYPDFSDPDPGYRMLALFRYWNFIQYWYPYRDLVDGIWENALIEFIPRFAQAETGKLYGREITALAVRVKDGHINVWREEPYEKFMPGGGPCWMPFLARPIEGEAVVYHTIQEVGIDVGDVILAVQGESINGLMDSLAPYYAASNRSARQFRMVPFVLKGECGPTSIKLRRSGAVFTLNIDRVELTSDERREGRFLDRPGETFQRLSDDVAYLKLSSVTRADAAEYIRKADGAKGLIIDIRNVPSDMMWFALGQHLVADSTEFARATKGSTADPGAFSFTESQILVPAAPYYEGQVIILVNEDNQSRSEYTAMAFQSRPGTIVVGSTTAGADGNTSRFPLPGGIGTTFSGIGVFYPDKTPTQRVGIIPDVFVAPTIQGIRDGRDEVLEAALAIIMGEKASREEIMELARRN